MLRAALRALCIASTAALMLSESGVPTRRAILGGFICCAAPPPVLSSPLPERGVRTPSGLMFIDFAQGTGPSPRFGQLLRFHYVGYTVDQQRATLSSIDSSYDRNSPYFIKHGNGYTCQGIEEALHTMRAGGRRRVIVPPKLGFTADKGPLPPTAGARNKLFDATVAGQPLVFDLELVSVSDDLLDRGDYEDGVRAGPLEACSNGRRSHSSPFESDCIVGCRGSEGSFASFTTFIGQKLICSCL